ncbi:hypothetical protein CDAR_523181 [Caerostris darwini]|uniref:Uncharacterized protein n=1 Tax=Caerostris darwini TaxID=1538125 RepID=A0AAV4U9J3_9ARAC|nr:hypothetical protein CDAR_523181 [Caerostris darwini]
MKRTLRSHQHQESISKNYPPPISDGGEEKHGLSTFRSGISWGRGPLSSDAGVESRAILRLDSINMLTAPAQKKDLTSILLGEEIAGISAIVNFYIKKYEKNITWSSRKYFEKLSLPSSPPINEGRKKQGLSTSRREISWGGVPSSRDVEVESRAIPRLYSSNMLTAPAQKKDLFSVLLGECERVSIAKFLILASDPSFKPSGRNSN